MSSLFSWIATLAMPQVVLSAALLAAVISIGAIVSNRKTTRQKNTIDLMMDITFEDSLKPALDQLRKIHKDEARSVEVLAKSDDSSAEATDIRVLLNYFENVAVGVRNGIYDEQIIRNSRKTMIQHSWQMSKPY